MIANISHFQVKSAGLQLSRSGAQTMIDSDKRQKEKMRKETPNVKGSLRFDLRSTGLAPEVKVYRDQTPIFSTHVFFNNF